jgi:hypothetical protein
MVRAKLKLVNKGRAPEREALAKAIAALAEVDRDLHEHHEAAARARALVAEAREKLAKARDGVERAKDAAVNLAMAGKPATARIRKARQAEADAEDALDVAEGLLSKWVEWEAKAPSGEHYVERKAVDEAAWAVIRASGWPERLFAEARAAQEEAFRTRAALRFFADSDAVFPKDPPGQFGEVSSFLWSRAELPTCRGDIEYADWRAHPGALLWMETLEALRRDPDAALPE